MPANIDQLYPALKAAYENAKAEYIRDNPDLPRPMLVFTYRSPEFQNALFLQGRALPAVINSARKSLGLYALTPEEAKRRVTNARGGQSPHNYLPAMAFDVAFTANGGRTVLWTDSLYPIFAKYMRKHAGITWGGDFKTIKDMPHFEMTQWRELVKVPKAQPVARVATSPKSLT